MHIMQIKLRNDEKKLVKKYFKLVFLKKIFKSLPIIQKR